MIYSEEGCPLPVALFCWQEKKHDSNQIALFTVRRPAGSAGHTQQKSWRKLNGVFLPDTHRLADPLFPAETALPANLLPAIH